MYAFTNIAPEEAENNVVLTSCGDRRAMLLICMPLVANPRIDL